MASNNPLQIFSIKLSSSTLNSIKIKTLIHFFSRVFSKGKQLLIQLLKQKKPLQFITGRKKTKNNMKILFGSFRLHYNYCSSHVAPLPVPEMYYESKWSSIVSTEKCEEGIGSSQHLSGYLEWLEEKVVEENDNEDVNDIDRLADLFIANCHEKFILEKQESYRRFHEMLARSV